MKPILILIAIVFTVALVACTTLQATREPDPAPTDIPAASLPNPASVFCEEHGGKVEIRTAQDGSQSGACIFPDGSECDEWAYSRGECKPGDSLPAPEATEPPAAEEPASEVSPNLPTAVPINPADYQGWRTYTNPAYGFSLQLPEDWVLEEIDPTDPLLGGHLLTLHPEKAAVTQAIRMTFRKVGEDVLLWPTGAGQGEFIEQGTLEVAGQPARRVLLVCPTGEVTSIYYQGEAQANLVRGDLEFGFIYSSGPHCETGISLAGKTQYVGEMIIASLQVP